MTETVYLSTRKGRSTGKLHTDPDCPALARSDEDHRMDRPRGYFDEDREFCRVCTSERDTKEERDP